MLSRRLIPFFLPKDRNISNLQWQKTIFFGFKRFLRWLLILSRDSLVFLKTQIDLLKTAWSYPENENKRKEQRLSFTDLTGLHRLIRTPQHGHVGMYFQSIWSVDNNRILPQVHLIFEMEKN